MPKRVERRTDKVYLVLEKNNSSTFKKGFKKGYEWKGQTSDFKTFSALSVAGAETRRAS